jgi:transposase
VASDDVPNEENKQLRAWIRELETERETEREILRRAAKCFAGETDW